MNKLFASVLIAAAVGLSAAAVQAMPIVPDQAPSMITQVAGGCGIGFHRGPYGGCRRNGYYGGVYYGAPAVVVAPGVVVGPVGPCGGRGAHQVCGPYGGNCRMVCNY
jgi:hypothetical protein